MLPCDFIGKTAESKNTISNDIAQGEQSGNFRTG